jgi:cAMP-dependent protein kinase regulator
VSAEAFGAWN